MNWFNLNLHTYVKRAAFELTSIPSHRIYEALLVDLRLTPTCPHSSQTPKHQVACRNLPLATLGCLTRVKSTFLHIILPCSRPTFAYSSSMFKMSKTLSPHAGLLKWVKKENPCFSNSSCSHFFFVKNCLPGSRPLEKGIGFIALLGNGYSHSITKSRTHRSRTPVAIFLVFLRIKPFPPPLVLRLLYNHCSRGTWVQDVNCF